MAAVISEFFGIVGVDVLAPSTLAELIPYLLNIFVGVVLVVSVFRLVSAVAKGFINMRRI